MPRLKIYDAGLAQWLYIEQGPPGAKGDTGVAGRQSIVIKVVPSGTSLTTGNGKGEFTVWAEINGMNLVDADAAVYTVSSSGTPTIQISRDRGGSVNDMLSTPITIDVNEKNSYTAATAPVINGTYDDLATGDIVSFDVDVSGTGAKGLDLMLVVSP